MTDNKSTRVWLVTGTSTGLGRLLVQSALRHGDRVIATARDVSTLAELEGDSCRTLQLDVCDGPEVLKRNAEEALGIWGTVDVLVNNAATTVLGAVEELGAESFARQYTTNVFGVINITNAFLPHMRACKAGDIAVIGSRTAWEANAPMIGAYASSKAAVHAIAETLSAELAPFNIGVLLVEPGSLHTDNLKAAVKHAQTYPIPELPAYITFHEDGRKRLSIADGNQLGDPARAAETIVDVIVAGGIARSRGRPCILALGCDAEAGIRAKCQKILKDLDDWAEISKAVAYDSS